MSTHNEDWEKGIVKLSLFMGRTKRLKWFWNYVILKKPLFVEISFWGRVCREDGYITSPVPQFMSLMEDFCVASLEPVEKIVNRVIPK